MIIIEKDNMKYFCDRNVTNPIENIQSCPTLTYKNHQWKTPGLYLAHKIYIYPLVRFVGERFFNDYTQIIVIINNDEDELLDTIFSIEQKMFKIFNRMKFDLRVKTLPASKSIRLIIMSSIEHFNREEDWFNFSDE